MLSTGRNGSRAMADRLVFTAPNGEKTGQQNPLSRNTSKSFHLKPPPAFIAAAGALRVPAHRALNGTENQRGSLPQQPSPASPPTCLMSKNHSQRSRRINTAVSLKRSHRNGNTLSQLAADPFKRISRTNCPAVTFTVRDESLRILAETSERT